MAVNETEVPEQLGLLPLLCRIDTAGVSDGFTVMMMAFDVETAADHGLHHFRAQILVVVRGRHGEIAFLVTRPVAQVVLLAARIPAAFLGVNKVEARMRVLLFTDWVWRRSS